jgi:FAD/FMN-containing dehydrogenase
MSAPQIVTTSAPLTRAQLPDDLRAVALTPQDPSYRDHAPTFFRGGAPAVILQARDAEHVRSAVLLAAEHPDLPFSVRSGGHGVSGRSTNHGGIVLDLAAMNDIVLADPGAGLVRVEPGAQWLDVARTLQPHGLGISSGDYGGVGVGGLATAGGAGWMVREHGLTIDHVRAVDMVLADGSSVRADATTLPDLFWAVRGAGSNFGVVTAFEIAASPVSAVGYAQFVLVADDAAQLLVGWGAALESAPRKVTSSVILGPSRPGQPVVAQVNTVVHSEQPDEIRELLEPFAAVGQLAQQSAQVVPYPDVIDNVYPGPHQGVGEPHSRAAVVRHITPDLANGFADVLGGGEAFYFQIRALGGAVADVPADATAFAHRDANFLPGALGRSRDGMNREWDRLRPQFDGTYASGETDDRPGRLTEAFPPATLARLRGLKRCYDPHNLFRDNFNIDPAGIDESEHTS